jgi:hypothetical protein
MRITGIAAAVEHLRPARGADAYAGRESLTFLRLRVTTDAGLVGAALRDRLATHPALVGGRLQVPDAPGLGFSLVE